MSIFGKLVTLVKKITSCDFDSTVSDITNEVTINANQRTTDIRNDIQNSNSNGISNARSSENRRSIRSDSRLSQDHSNPVIHDLICLGENEAPAVPQAESTLRSRPIFVGTSPVRPKKQSAPQPILRLSNEIRSATEELSKTFKEYVQRQVEDLVEDVLNFKGTTIDSEYNRLQRRIDRQLEDLANMCISDTSLKNKWNAQVTNMQVVLAYNTRKRQEKVENERIAQRNVPIKTEIILAPIHQLNHISQHNAKKESDKQQLKIDSAKLEATLLRIQKQLTIFADKVFNFCNCQRNEEYYYIENTLIRELTLLRSIDIKDFPHLKGMKNEIEQFGCTWKEELSRRPDELKIRSYEARIKTLW